MTGVGGTGLDMILDYGSDAECFCDEDGQS